MGGLLPTKNQHHTPKVDNKLPTLLAVARQMEADSSMNAIAKNKTAPRPLLPRLRFAGFRGEWESVPLGSLGKFFRGLTYGSNDVADGGLLVLRSSNIQGGRLILDSDLVFVAKQCPSDLRLRRGDVVICMSNGSKALVGKSAELDRDYSGELTVGAFCSIFRPLIHFAKIAFDTQQYADFVSIGIAGGNINNLKNSDLEAFEFHIPQEEAEQQKIAACLSSLDTLITAEAQKLDTLKTHKKGLMQQLFPRAGETTPRLRFAEFRGEWEQMPLCKVCNVLQGYGFPEALQGEIDGKYPFCKVSDISKAVAENGGNLVSAANYIDDEVLLKLKAKTIPNNSTVFAKIGEALRLNRRAYVRKECLIDNNVTGLKAIDEVADDYFIYLLSQMIDLNNYCGGAVPSVNKATLEEIPVVIPTLEEQQKIAACLSSLDELITAQAQKVAALQTHKKGLMQQLFPAHDEASA